MVTTQHPRPRKGPVVLVSGGAQASDVECAHAEEVGRLLAEAGAIVLTGGGPGVMEAASRGARAAGGTTVGVLPGRNRVESPPNPHVLIAVFSGMSEARNTILAHTADVVIAIGGGWGTLSEIALARKVGRPVIRLASWELTAPDAANAGEMPPRAQSAKEAVRAAMKAIGRGPQDPPDVA